MTAKTQNQIERARRGPHVTIDLDCPHVLAWSEGLDLFVEIDEDEYLVWGPDIYLFLARVDPATWSAACAVGEA